MFAVLPGGAVRDMRGDLVRDLLTYLVVDVSSAAVTQGQPPKYYRVPLDGPNMVLLRQQATADPTGPFAKLLEIDAEVGVDLLRSGSGTDFYVIAPPGSGADSNHSDVLLMRSEVNGRSRLVQKDAAGPLQVLCSTKFRVYPQHNGGRRLPNREEIATVPCGPPGGSSYASDPVECAMLQPQL